MSNPFEVIELKLNSIEDLILDIKNKPSETDNPLRYRPIAKWCDEMGMTTANMYHLARKKVVKLKKLGGKTFVDVEQVEAAMRDFQSEVAN